MSNIGGVTFYQAPNWWLQGSPQKHQTWLETNLPNSVTSKKIPWNQIQQGSNRTCHVIQIHIFMKSGHLVFLKTFPFNRSHPFICFSYLKKSHQTSKSKVLILHTGRGWRVSQSKVTKFMSLSVLFWRTPRIFFIWIYERTAYWLCNCHLKFNNIYKK